MTCNSATKDSRSGTVTPSQKSNDKVVLANLQKKIDLSKFSKLVQSGDKEEYKMSVLPSVRSLTNLVQDAERAKPGRLQPINSHN